MLGKEIVDEFGVEISSPSLSTFGYMNHTTYFGQEKTINQVDCCFSGMTIKGFEIHHGITESNDEFRGFVINSLKINKNIPLDDVNNNVCPSDLFPP